MVSIFVTGASTNLRDQIASQTPPVLYNSAHSSLLKTYGELATTIKS